MVAYTQRENAAPALKPFLAQYLEMRGEKVGKKFACPFCGSGLKEKGTPAFSVHPSGEKFRCFSCGKSGDIIDVCQAVENCGKLEAFELLKNLFLLGEISTPAGPAKRAPISKPKEVPAPDFSEYVAKARDAFKGSPAAEYLSLRGISWETAAAAGVGYDPNYKGAASDRRVIFPYVEDPAAGVVGYRARRIRAIKEPRREGDFLSAGRSSGWRKEALIDAAAPVFVCEGEIDALSFLEIGAAAVAVPAGQGAAIVNYIKRLKANHRPKFPLIIALDSDTPGQNAQASLLQNLAAENIPALAFDSFGVKGAKDPNEALLKDRTAFSGAVIDAIAKASAAGPVDRISWEIPSARERFESFASAILADDPAPCVPTGFRDLDNILDGGFYPGLYTFFGGSGLGKTTLIMQILDNIAKGGGDVVFYSLEMDAREIMAKSVSRETLKLSKARNMGQAGALRTRSILRGAAGRTRPQTDTLQEALNIYKGYADKVFIYESRGDVSAAKIRLDMERYRESKGRGPAALAVDYVQILEGEEGRAGETEKQKIDRAIIELKRISRDYGVPVIAISSVNRASYWGAVSLSDAKESGAIEYGSDVVIGLQPSGFDYEKEDAKESTRAQRLRQIKEENERAAKAGLAFPIDAKILKNRNGRRDACILRFNPCYNFYEDDTGDYGEF